ncbi:MAG TPA: hypothetical protein VFV38_18590 [Ktedonobacteraceae bacterium]|nr:hypothetical protein [Ktedonobacteraceae bacterium]
MVSASRMLRTASVTSLTGDSSYNERKKLVSREAMKSLTLLVVGCQECQDRYRHLTLLSRQRLQGAPAARGMFPSAWEEYLRHQQQKHAGKKV